VSPTGKDLNTFVDACETLLRADIVAADFTLQESQIIQYYIAALAAKYPALLK
jgi:hypothetical protein